MRLLRDRLQVLENTKGRIVLQENPHFVVGCLSLVFGLSIITAILFRPATQLEGTLFVALAGVSLTALGLFGLVRSTIAAERKKGLVRIERRLCQIVFTQQYALKNIKRAFERRTLKGNGLRLELLDGKRRNLSLWTEYSSLGEQVEALNNLIRTGTLDDAEESVIGFMNERFRRNFQLDSPVPFGFRNVNAVSFFHAFEECFRLDLTPLREEWDLQFSSNDRTVAWIVGVVLSLVVVEFLRWPTWGWAILVIIASGVVYRFVVGRRESPILVQDLADAVKAGKWAKQYGGTGITKATVTRSNLS